MALDMTGLRSRRALLAGALGAAGSAAAATIAGAQRVLGAGSDGEPVVIGANDPDIRTHTTLRSVYRQRGGQPGFVFGTDFPGSDGLDGRTTTVSGDGIETAWYSSLSGRIWETTIGPGIDVYGGKHSGVGLQVNTTDGPAIMGRSERIGVRGLGDVGVRGTGRIGVAGAGRSRGRGGVFSGGKAQVRLTPSTATSHPSSGAAGDLFVDRSKRLWFCQGGSTWVRLA